MRRGVLVGICALAAGLLAGRAAAQTSPIYAKPGDTGTIVVPVRVTPISEDDLLDAAASFGGAGVLKVSGGSDLGPATVFVGQNHTFQINFAVAPGATEGRVTATEVPISNIDNAGINPPLSSFSYNVDLFIDGTPPQVTVFDGWDEVASNVDRGPWNPTQGQGLDVFVNDLASSGPNKYGSGPARLEVWWLKSDGTQQKLGANNQAFTNSHDYTQADMGLATLGFLPVGHIQIRAFDRAGNESDIDFNVTPTPPTITIVDPIGRFVYDRVKGDNVGNPPTTLSGSESVHITTPYGAPFTSVTATRNGVDISGQLPAWDSNTTVLDAAVGGSGPSDNDTYVVTAVNSLGARVSVAWRHVILFAGVDASKATSVFDGINSFKVTLPILVTTSDGGKAGNNPVIETYSFNPALVSPAQSVNVVDTLGNQVQLFGFSGGTPTNYPAGDSMTATLDSKGNGDFFSPLVKTGLLSGAVIMQGTTDALRLFVSTQVSVVDLVTGIKLSTPACNGTISAFVVPLGQTPCQLYKDSRTCGKAPLNPVHSIDAQNCALSASTFSVHVVVSFPDLAKKDLAIGYGGTVTGVGIGGIDPAINRYDPGQSTATLTNGVSLSGLNLSTSASLGVALVAQPSLSGYVDAMPGLGYAMISKPFFGGSFTPALNSPVSVTVRYSTASLSAAVQESAIEVMYTAPGSPPVLIAPASIDTKAHSLTFAMPQFGSFKLVVPSYAHPATLTAGVLSVVSDQIVTAGNPSSDSRYAQFLNVLASRGVVPVSARAWSLSGSSAVFNPPARLTLSYTAAELAASRANPGTAFLGQYDLGSADPIPLFAVQADTSTQAFSALLSVLVSTPVLAVNGRVPVVPAIDLLPPQTTLFAGGAAVVPSTSSVVVVASTATLALRATDPSYPGAPASGVAGTFYLLDQAFISTKATPGSPYSAPFTLSGGTHTLVYYSRDAAGNVEAGNTAVVFVMPQPSRTVGGLGLGVDTSALLWSIAIDSGNVALAHNSLNGVFTASAALAGADPAFPWTVLFDAAGNPYAVGAAIAGNGADQLAVYKPSPAGDAIASSLLFDSGYNNNNLVFGAAAPGWIVGGIQTSGPIQGQGSRTYSMALWKFDPTRGLVQLTTTYTRAGQDIGTGVALDAAGNVWVSGFSFSPNPRSPRALDLAVWKFSPDGKTLLAGPFIREGYLGDFNTQDTARVVVSSGIVYVATPRGRGAGGTDTALIAFDAATGRVLSENAWRSGDGASTYVSELMQDAGGRLLAAGSFDYGGTIAGLWRYGADGTLISASQTDAGGAQGAVFNGANLWLTVDGSTSPYLDVNETAAAGSLSDVLPPRTSLAAGNPSYQSSSTLYVAATTPLSFASVDDKIAVLDGAGVGVAQIFYSTDSGPFAPSPKSFALVSEGTHTVSFYSLDQEGNAETVGSAAVAVDLTAPIVAVSALSSTTFAITAVDPVVNGAASGVAAINYLLDVDPRSCRGVQSSSAAPPGTCANFTYAGPFNLPTGTHTVYFQAVDNVGNGQNVILSSAVTVAAPVPAALSVASIAPSSAATGTTLGVAVTGTGFDATAALSLKLWNVLGGSWTATGSLATGRDDAAAVRLLDGRVLVAGGHAGDTNASFNTVEIYDPAAGTWTAAAPMAASRYAFTMVRLADGRVLAAGGRQGPTLVDIASAEIYDPASNTWTPTGSMTQARVRGSVFTRPDGKILVAGGAYNSGFLSSVDIYDAAAGTWSAGPAMNAARYAAGSAKLKDGRFLLTGGSAALNSSEAYDPATNSWTALAPMSTGRVSHTLTVLGDGRVLAAGDQSVFTAEVYDPAADAWTPAGTLSDQHSYGAAFLIGGKVLVVGGSGSHAGGADAVTDLYDPATNSWTPGPTLAAGRLTPTVTLLADGRLLAASGATNGYPTPAQTSAELLTVPSATIAASGVSVADSRHLSGTLNLIGAATGYWDAVVTEPGNKTASLASGFRVLTAYYVAASTDGGAKLVSQLPTQALTPVSTGAAAGFYAAAASSQGLVGLGAYYDLRPSPVVFNPAATLSLAFNPAAVDTTTVAIYWFNGVSWDSAAVTGQTVQVLGTTQAVVTGQLAHASLYAAFWYRRDNLPPRTSLSVGAPRYGANPVYVAPATPLGFTAIDDRLAVGDGAGLGVARTLYAVDAGSFTVYAGSFTIAAEGAHVLRFYSVDVVGNAEAVQVSTVVVDATSPQTTLQIAGLWSASGSTGPASGGDVLSANATTPLPSSCNGFGFAAYNGRVYTAGCNGNNAPGVFSAPVSADGAVGAWRTETNQLPYGVEGGPALTQWNGRLYFAGGYNYVGGATQNAVWTAPINADGTVGAWVQQAASLPTPVNGNSLAAWNGRLYSVGGSAYAHGSVSAVYAAPVNADGSVGAWAATTSLPQPLSWNGVFAYNGYVYTVGGVNATSPVSAVYSAPIGADGALGAWASQTPLPQALSNTRATAVSGGRVYVVGGYTGSQGTRTIYSAALGANGTAGAWRLESVGMPADSTNAGLVAWNGELIAAGAGASSTAVYVLPLRAPSVGGYVSAATQFALSAVDPASGGVASGVAFTRYRVNGGAFATSPLSFHLAGPDGPYAIDYQSQDNVTNLEAQRTASVLLDQTPPVTTVSIGSPAYTAADGTVYATPATPVTFAAADPNLPGGQPGSGVGRIEVALDGGAFAVYAATLTLAEGRHSVLFRAVDNVGNVEATRALAIQSDATPPVSSLALSTPSFSGFVSGATLFSLSAVDPVVSSVTSGVAFTRYRVNGGAFAASPLAFRLTGPDGAYQVDYQSQDGVGNLEVLRSTAVFLDQTPPVTTPHIGAPGYVASDGTQYVTPATPVAFTAVDPSSGAAASGINRIEVALDGGAFAAYTATLTFVEGRHSVLYRAVDNVGNVEATRTLNLQSDATPPVTAFKASGSYFTVNAPEGPRLYAPLAFAYSLPATDPVASNVASGLAFTRYRTGPVTGYAGAPVYAPGAFATYASTFSLAEGIRRVEFQSQDNVGNQELLKSATVFVDATPPVTALSIGAPQYAAGGTLYVSTATPFALNSQDPIVSEVASGVAGVFFRLDANPFTPYSAAFTMPVPDGAHAAAYYAVDNVGNLETAKSSAVALDATPPQTSLLVVGGRQFPGPDGRTFYASPDTRLALTAVDPVVNGAASGVAWTRWLDNGGAFSVYLSTLGFAEGAHALGFQSQDNVANLEVLGSTNVWIDATPPVTTVAVGSPTYTAADGTIYVTPATPISLAASDPSLPSGQAGSGVNRIEVALDGGAYAPYTTALRLPEGRHVILYRAVDNVANVEAYRTLAVQSDATPPVSSLVIGQPQYRLPSVLLVSSRTPFAVAAIDPVAGGVASGVKDSWYNVNDVAPSTGAFSQFLSSFTLSGPDANKVVQFYSRDNVLNTEAVQSGTVLLDSTPPEVALLSPASCGSGICRVLKGRFPVQGTARDPHFSSYVLEFAAGRNAASGYALISSGTAAVSSGVLGTWDASTLTGWQTLRLTATDLVGNVSLLTVDVYVGDPATLMLLGGHDTFGMPAGVAVGGDGKIYVADRDNDRIAVFTSTGAPLASFGARDDDRDDVKRSTGALRLEHPMGVAVDAAGDIFIADTGHQRVLELSATGQVLMTIGARRGEDRGGRRPGEFNKPTAVALDASGGIYVSDTENHRVQVFSSTGGWMSQIALPAVPQARDDDDRNEREDRDGDDRAALGKPLGLALDAAGRLYVADAAGHRVLEYGATGNLLLTIPVPGDRAGQSGSPFGVAVSTGGDCLLVSDARFGHIRKFDFTGAQNLVFGARARGDDDDKRKPAGIAFRKPAGLALDAAGNLYVADRNAEKIEKFGLPTGRPTLVTPPARPDDEDHRETARDVLDRDSGGTVSRRDHAGVSVPAGALADDLKITVSTMSQASAAQSDAMGRTAEGKGLKPAYAPVEYGPEGTKFAAPVTLTVPYNPQLVAQEGLSEDSLKVHYWNKASGDWEALESVVDKDAHTVTAKTPHFSLYQVLGSTGGAGIGVAAVDATFGLKAAYAFPNPAHSGAVTLRIQPGLADSVSVRVYDVSGRKVHDSSNFTLNPALDDGNGLGAQYTYDHLWDISGVGSGVYTYVITAKHAGNADIHKTGKIGVAK